MTKQALWELLTQRNPPLLTGGSMTPEGYRKFFDLVWREAQKELAEQSIGDMPDFLKGLFR